MFLTFQKIEGCNKMTCAKCRCYFCWVCNTMLDTRNPYVHFTDTNLKCYNQLMARVEVENHITVPYVKIWMQVILVIEQSVRKRCTFILGVCFLKTSLQETLLEVCVEFNLLTNKMSVVQLYDFWSIEPSLIECFRRKVLQLVCVAVWFCDP